MSNLQKLEEALGKVRAEAHKLEKHARRVECLAGAAQQLLARVWPEEGLPSTFCPDQTPVDEDDMPTRLKNAAKILRERGLFRREYGDHGGDRAGIYG